MSVDPTEALSVLRERQLLAAKRYADGPLPHTDDEARVRLRSEIDRHELHANIVDLEMQGYTILPPGLAAPLAFTDRLHEAILRVAAERAERIRANATEVTKLEQVHNIQGLFHLIAEDPVFQEAICNPVVLTLVTYLAGYRAKLTYGGAIVKTGDTNALMWHTDNTAKVPLPFPQQSVSANVNWILSDYTPENGPLCVVPGSHLWCRDPEPGFSFDDDRVVRIEVPAGSLAIWHANLWHAAMPRKTEGQRVNFITVYERAFMQSGDAFMFTSTPEMIANNPPRFSVLMGFMNMLFLATERGGDPRTEPSRTSRTGRWT